MNLKHIKELEGSYSSKVELVIDENDKLWVLKTVPENEIEKIINEKYFLKTLSENGLNAIKFQDSPYNKPNQVLLEYLQNSVTVGDSKEAKIFELFGVQVAKMHEIRYGKCYQLKLDGKEFINWESFVFSDLEHGISRIKSKNIDFSDFELDLIKERISKICTKSSISTFSLLHADLHTNNALYSTKLDQVYLFDKGSAVLSGHPHYDLALILIEFPHLFGLPAITDMDQELFKSFIKGCGFNFWHEDRELCLDYVLLRAITRVGSPFTLYLEDLIRKIIL